MERAFTLNELAAACDGLLLGTTGGGQTRIQELCTDSRLDLQDSLFVALVGERLDGHDYLAQAVENGAAALLVHNEILAKQWQTKLPVLLVEDTESALRAIARFYRDSLDLTVVAVTGSVGKTSTRDTIAQALRDQVVVHQTKANLNNMFGVPYTLLDTPLAAEVAVIECGMDHLGEIRDASLAAHPDITVITNIGTSHIENLGSRATILKAKAEILISQKSGGPLVINGEDPYLLQLAQDKAASQPIIFITTEGQAGSLRTRLKEDAELPEADAERLAEVALLAAEYRGANLFPGLPSGTILRAAEIQESAGGMSFSVHCEKPGGETIVLPQVRLIRPGLQQLENALNAIAVAMLLGLDPERSASALRELRLTSGRQQVEELSDGNLLIDDTYNASPESMKAAFHLAEVLQRNPAYESSVVVLGGVNELGTYALELHEDIGRAAGKSAFSQYYLLGPWADKLAAGVLEANPGALIATFAEQDQLTEALLASHLQRSVILVKASRGYQMENICKALRKALPRHTRRSAESEAQSTS